MLRSVESALFAGTGDRARLKIVVLDTEESEFELLPSRLRSLNFIEHVSPATLMGPGISRPLALGSPKREESRLALMRRWFWARKPDAGFLLHGFPATLLQALVFEEWLEARNESLDAVFFAKDGSSASPIFRHYQLSGVVLTLDQLNESP